MLNSPTNRGPLCSWRQTEVMRDAFAGSRTSASCHVRPFDEAHDEHADVRVVGDDLWCRAGRGCRYRVGVLVVAVDREQGAFRRRQSCDDLAVGRRDLEVAVRETTGQIDDSRARSKSRDSVEARDQLRTEIAHRDLYRHRTLRDALAAPPGRAVPLWYRNASARAALNLDHTGPAR